MKSKHVITVLCAMLVLIASSPQVSAAGEIVFAEGGGDVEEFNILLRANLLHFDIDESEDIDPEWEWNDLTQDWEMDYTANPPHPLDIWGDVTINDLASEQNKRNIKIQAELTVVEIGGPGGPWVDTWQNPSWPNGDEFDGLGAPPEYSAFLDLSANNIPGNQGNTYRLTYDIKMWDMDDNPPTLSSDSISGTIFT
jgi:hypothetical protein